MGLSVPHNILKRANSLEKECVVVLNASGMLLPLLEI